MTPNDRGDVKLCESHESITPSPYNALQQLPVDDDDEHHTLPYPGGDDDGGDGDGDRGHYPNGLKLWQITKEQWWQIRQITKQQLSW